MTDSPSRWVIEQWVIETARRNHCVELTDSVLGEGQSDFSHHSEPNRIALLDGSLSVRTGAMLAWRLIA